MTFARGTAAWLWSTTTPVNPLLNWANAGIVDPHAMRISDVHKNNTLWERNTRVIPPPQFDCTASVLSWIDPWLLLFLQFRGLLQLLETVNQRLPGGSPSRR